MILFDITRAEGPNEWSSIYDRLTMLDLQVSDEAVLTEKEISLLLNEVESHFPSLIDYESGGLKKTPASGSRGALLSLLVELVATELQMLVGIPAVFSETIQPEAGMNYKVVFSCPGAEEGIYVGKAAVEIVRSLIERKPLDLNTILQELIVLHHSPRIQKAEAA